MINKIKLTAMATLIGFSSLAHAAEGGIDLVANEKPIDTPKNAAAAAKIPASYKFLTPGTLTVAIPGDGGVTPFAVLAPDNKTIIGSEIDIARLVADGLGLKLKLVPTSWPDWPLGVTSGKYDVALSNISVTKQRKTKFDFATYRTNHLAFYVANNSKITSLQKPADIAGKRIIVATGSIQESVLLKWDKINQAQGLAPVQPIYPADETSALLSLLSGRADAQFGAYAMDSYQSKVSGKTRLVGLVASGWPKMADIAVTLRKGSGLVDAVQASINSAIANGSYQKVLNRWGEGEEAISHSEINPPGLDD